MRFLASQVRSLWGASIILTTFTPPLNSPVQTLVLTYPSLTLVSLWLTTVAYLLTSAPNLQTNTNIYSIHLVIPYTLKMLFLSVKHSAYNVSVLTTPRRFNTRAAQLTTYLLKRGYNRNFVTKQTRRAADIPRRLTLQNQRRVPFITTFNPALPHISNIIKKHVFQHLPVVASRCSSNLRDLLVTAKISSNSSNPQLPSGSFRCGKNCATCPYISHGLTTYTVNARISAQLQISAPLRISAPPPHPPRKNEFRYSVRYTCTRRIRSIRFF